MKNPNQKAMLDLDQALEEVAKKLRPTANGECGTTAVESDAQNTNGKGICGCTCCSATQISDSGHECPMC